MAKAEVKFYLEKRKDKQTGTLITENVPILLFFSFEGKRLQYFTGLRVDMKKWDEAEQKVKRNYSETQSINDELNELRAKVKDVYNKAQALETDLTAEDLKEHLKGKKNFGKAKSWADCMQEYLDSSKITKGHGTLKAINTSFNVLNKFSKDTGQKLDFGNINQSFYDELLRFLFHDHGYNNNSAGKIIKDLKAFLNFATDKGYNSNLEFRKKAFKKLVEEPEIIFLTFEELKKLYEFEFSSQSWTQVRDVFCFGCFTGMRFSDIAALKPENILKDKILYRVVKTTSTNTIPLNKYSREILEKYNNVLPVISESKTNKYLKDLAKEAELNRTIQQIHFKGATRLPTSEPLHKIITFHVSKKTFMTNFLAKGGSLLTAMSITGNKDMKTARRYFKVVDELKAEEMKRVFD